jgi:CheY-like chemotaxis protein
LSRLIAPAGNQAEPRAELAEPTSPSRQNRLRVLVAEDEPVNALIAFAKLTRLGHVVVQVADGEAACAAFESEPFDVALLDIRMPKLDGLAAARRMRSFEAASGRARALLVAVTADIAGQDRQAAIDAGMDEVLIKPLDSRALRTLLAEPARARVA